MPVLLLWEGWYLQNHSVVYSYFRLLCAGAGIPLVPVAWVCALSASGCWEVGYMLPFAPEAITLCSGILHRCSVDLNGKVHHLTGGMPFGLGASLGPVVTGETLQVVSTVELREERGQKGTSSQKPSVSSPWWWLQRLLWSLWDWRSLQKFGGNGEAGLTMPTGKDPPPGDAGGCLVGRENLSSQLSLDSWSLVSGSFIIFSLDPCMNSGIVPWEHPWWIASNLLPGYGKFCLEQLYIMCLLMWIWASLDCAKCKELKEVWGTQLCDWDTFCPSKGKYKCPSATRILHFPHLHVLLFIL